MNLTRLASGHIKAIQCMGGNFNATLGWHILIVDILFCRIRRRRGRCIGCRVITAAFALSSHTSTRRVIDRQHRTLLYCVGHGVQVPMNTEYDDTEALGSVNTSVLM